MKKHIFALLLCVCLILTLSGCAASAASDSRTDSSVPDEILERNTIKDLPPSDETLPIKVGMTYGEVLAVLGETPCSYLNADVLYAPWSEGKNIVIHLVSYLFENAGTVDYVGLFDTAPRPKENFVYTEGDIDLIRAIERFGFPKCVGSGLTWYVFEDADHNEYETPFGCFDYISCPKARETE